MEDLIQKFKLIYLPFLITAIGFVGIYTFLHWLIILKFELFHIDEMYVDYWIPLCLVWIPVLLFLWKRIKLLKFKETARDPHFIYFLVAAIAIAFPTVIAQEYIRTASGQLSQFDTVEQIDSTPLTKYYQFDKLYLDKRFTSVYWFVDVGGRRNETMYFHGYFVLPIMAIKSDTSKRYYKTWYGIEYRDNISNRLSQPEKELEYRRFQTRTINEYSSSNLYRFVYFDRIGLNNQHKGLLEAVKVASNYDHSAEAIILKPIDEPFENRNGSKLGWIFGSFGIVGFVFLLMVIFPSFNETAVRKFETGYKPKSKVKFSYKGLLNLLIPDPDGEYFATHLMIELNMIIFLAMVFSGLGLISFRGDDLLNWGANYRPNVLNGEYWRLFTSTFLHGGLMHLLMNMYGLFFIGMLLEPILKYKKFILLYVIMGVIASISSIWWHTATVSVGASGAIFGLYGIFLALLLTNLYPPDFQISFLASTLVFVGYNLLFGLINGGIDNAAHIGGLVSGMLIGYLIYPQLKEEREKIK